jgi:very-short-patch-repair endonuclease
MRRSEVETAVFLDANAERMRHAPTEAERVLWEHLEPLGFQRQVEFTGCTKNGGMWQYILDFHWYRAGIGGGLCIEVDGSSHRNRKGRDRRRDTRLATIGIRTLRLSNDEVLRDTAGSMAKIRTAMKIG